MSYGRDDDRYYRGELAKLRDHFDELADAVQFLRDELRRDEPIATQDARSTLRTVVYGLRTSQRELDATLRALPAPTVNVERRSTVAAGGGEA